MYNSVNPMLFPKRNKINVKKAVYRNLLVLLLTFATLSTACSISPSSQPAENQTVTPEASPAQITTSASTPTPIPTVSPTPVTKPTPGPTVSPTPAITAAPTPDVQTLKSLANALGKDFGTAIPRQSMDDAMYMNTLNQQFNLIIAHEGMYMSQIQWQRGVWNFSSMDRMVNYAVANKFKIRGHTFIYGRHDSGVLGDDSPYSPTPAWVYDGNFSREEMIKIMDDHITAVIKRYGNYVDEWVVVNESASWDKAGGFANNIWQVRIGEDYIKLAFQKARELAPDAVLILNEWGGDYIGQTDFGREDNIYNHVKKLVEDGVPIDAIGLEFHLTVPSALETEPTIDSILANFERYSKLGLKVYVTELDVAIKEPVTQEKLDAQARVYTAIIEAVLQSNVCNSISVWDFTDLYSWIPSHYPGRTDACLFDKYIKPKAVYDSVIDVLKKYASQAPATKPPITVTTSPPTTPFPQVLSILAQYGTVEPEVVYSTAGGVELKMDIWQPKQSSSKKPVIIFVHGGGFSYGDKSVMAMNPMAAHWLGRGYLVASVNYRLSPESTFPAQVEDVKCAVRFLRENAVKYGINPDKIGACGVSAGGYLVSMLGVCDSSAGFDNSGGYLNQSSRLQAVVDLYGPSDFTLQFDGPNGAHSKFLGGADKFYEIAPKANPINYVSSDDPPFLIMHGDKDVEVIPAQSETLYKKLVAAKVPATLIWVKNAGHSFLPVGKEPVSPNQMEQNIMIADFFDKYLK